MPIGGRLVGREALLAEVVAAVTDHGSPVTVLSGEAGIGKSQLLAATVDRLSASGWVVLRGWCLDLSEAVPFLAVVDVLRELVRRDEGRIVKAALAGCPSFVEQEVRQLVPELIVDERTQMMPADASGWRRDRVFAAVDLLLGEVAEMTPIAVAVEDGQWADPSTMDWLRYHCTPGHRAGVPLLVTCREEGAAPSPLRDIATRGGGRWLDVGPLPAAAMAELVTSLGPTDSALVQRVVELSAGVPLYAEQLAAAPDPGRLPAGLSALFERDLEQLPASERRLMDALSVAGRPLDARELTVVAELPAGATAAALRGLVRHRLVDPSEVSRFRPHHALLAESVRQQLLDPDVRVLHHRVAEVLAAREDHTMAGDIADHFQASGDEVEEAAWRLVAGRYATSVAAAAEALHQWRRLVEMSREAADKVPRGADISLVDLYLETFSAMERAGADDAAALAQQAKDVLLPRAAGADQVRVLYELGRWRRIDDPQEGAELTQQAIDLGEGMPPSRAYVRALQQMAQHDAAESHGGLQAQVLLLNRALQAAGAAKLSEDEKHLTVTLAWRQMRAGRSALARNLLDQALSIAAAGEDPWIAERVAVYASDIQLKVGDLAAATRTGMAGIALLGQAGLTRSFGGGILLSNTMEALLERGETESARAAGRLLRDALLTRTSAPAFAMLAAVRLAAGEREAVRAFWRDPKSLTTDWGLQFDREFAVRKCDYLLWAGQATEVPEIAVPLLQALAATDEARFAGGLFVLAARACADLAEVGHARSDTATLSGVTELMDELSLARAACVVDPFGTDGVPSTATADGLSWTAELNRARHRNDGQAWAHAAEAWIDCGRPHRAAYALWRQAEVTYAEPSRRPEAARTLRDAHLRAAGHSPLRDGISALARRANVALTEAAQVSPAGPKGRPFGLTERELTVVQLLSQGLTNGQIGARLYLSPKTASVHVSNVMRKMGVTSRVQAATTAAQRGLLLVDDADAGGSSSAGHPGRGASEG